MGEMSLVEVGLASVDLMRDSWGIRKKHGLGVFVCSMVSVESLTAFAWAGKMY